MTKRSQNAPGRDANCASEIIRKILFLWHKTEVWIAIIAFSLIALILIFDVVAREILGPVLAVFGREHTGLFLYGSQKYAVFLMIIGAFAGIGIATWTGAQLVPRIGSNLFANNWDMSVNRVADIVSFCVLLGVTGVASQFVFQSRELGVLASGGIGVAVWQVQLAIPLGFASAAMRYLAFAIWPNLRPADPGPSE